LSVVAAAGGISLMQTDLQAAAHVSLLLLAVIISTWFGGTKPGVFAVILSVLALAYFTISANHSLGFETAQVPRLVLLAIVASCVVLVIATEKGAVDSLKRAHDDLRRINEILRTENTERMRAEQARSESQQLLHLVLATLPVGVVVTDRTGDIVLANAASNRIWGYTIVSGRERWAQSKGAWHDSGNTIAPTDWASVRALTEGQISLNELIDIETHDGVRKTIQNSSAPIRNAEGLIVGAVIVNEDVTDRARAEKALSESLKRLQQLSHRLMTVQEQERRHLSRELHDEFGQLLATAALHLHAAKSLAGSAAQASLQECMVLLQRAGAQLRDLALELRPVMLETAGLHSTLIWLAKQNQQRTGIATEVTGYFNVDVSAEVAIVIFRVAQEALTNVVRHAQAQHVWIELRQTENALGLEVRDDGVGFDVTGTLERAAGRGHLGLLGMKERVQILGGSFEADSEPGHGTSIRISLPLVQPHPTFTEPAA
jgi:PAS domain S-box-containing protein